MPARGLTLEKSSRTDLRLNRKRVCTSTAIEAASNAASTNGAAARSQAAPASRSADAAPSSCVRDSITLSRNARSCTTAGPAIASVSVTAANPANVLSSRETAT